MEEDPKKRFRFVLRTLFASNMDVSAVFDTTMSKLNKYRNLKLAQAGVLFAVVILFVVLMYLGLSDDIELLIMTPVLLVCTIICIIAAVLLHIGNVYGQIGCLKAFLVFGCISYSPFDKWGGGFAVVRKRMTEIEEMRAGVSPIAVPLDAEK